MLAGHYATALVAKQQAPRGALAFYLVASQLPDLLWLTFHFLGLERTTPTNPMDVSLKTLVVDMTYSHDLLPTLGWIVLLTLAGKALFASWKPALVGGLLLVVHAVTDYLGGFPHHVFGPDSHEVGTGLYRTAPYLAVALEGIFTLAMLAWVVRTDAKAGVARSRGTWRAWIGVFGGGLAFMFLSADMSLAELTGVAPPAAMDGWAVPVLVTSYVAMIAALLWAEGQPRNVAADGANAAHHAAPL
ncbi:MAG: hypothetical protein AAF447_15710 [Myxococcota bacterium]